MLGIKMGQTTKDGKFTLAKASWLAWCVNGAPAAMIKRKGSDKLVSVLNLHKINSVDELLGQAATEVPCTYEVLPYTRKGEGLPSFFKKYDLKAASDKAMAMGADKVIEEISKAGL